MVTALLSAYGLGVASIVAIADYRRFGPKTSPLFLAAGSLILLVFLVISVRKLLSQLANQDARK